MAKVPQLEKNFKPAEGSLVIDARDEKTFKAGHYRGAINIQNGGKFETWLGSIIAPGERFYLAAASEQELDELIAKAAKIGYELLIEGAFVLEASTEKLSPVLDLETFREHPDRYTIVDVRNESEVKTGKFFGQSINIPLPQLRDRVQEIPRDKPVVVHCAGGYRSAAGSSIVEAALPDVEVLDMSEAINSFQKS